MNPVSWFIWFIDKYACTDTNHALQKFIYFSHFFTCLMRTRCTGEVVIGRSKATVWVKGGFERRGASWLAQKRQEVFQGHGKSYTKDDRSEGQRNQVESTNIIVNQKQKERTKTNNLNLHNPRLVKTKISNEKEET